MRKCIVKKFVLIVFTIENSINQYKKADNWTMKKMSKTRQ